MGVVSADPSEQIRPWVDLVEEIRADRKLSQDDLAHEARIFGAPRTLTGSQISMIKKGTRPYSTRFFEGIAGALDISPFRFAEYHLALARELLDERHFGLDEALGNIDNLADLIAEASEMGGPPSEGRRLLLETSDQISAALAPDAESAAKETETQAARRTRGRA